MISDNNPKNSESKGGVYAAQISEDGLLILRGLIGRQIFRVLAPCLQAAGAHFAAPSLSIPFSDEVAGKWSHRYVNIRCEWSETPLTLTDYWDILITCENRPTGIDVDSRGAVVAPCTINFYMATPIKKIELYEFLWPVEPGDCTEAVRYDQAIRFEREDGTAICVACQLDGPGIATEVHISEDEVTIREFLEGSNLRVSMTAR